MIYKKIISPLLFYWSRNDPEKAHEVGIKFLYYIGKHKIIATFIERSLTVRNKRLEVEVWGLEFRNPLALAAGFDKNGTARHGIQSLGVGFEVLGSVTRYRQKGSDRPRTFRLIKDRSLINWMGFNNDGAVAISKELKNERELSIPLGISLGKSLITSIENAIEDYSYSLQKLYLYGDFFIIDISSPNTLDLRELQKKEYLENIIIRLQDEIKALNKQHNRKKPLLIKIAPDLTQKELDDILDICMELKIDGIVAVNTTTSRENTPMQAPEKGGLSGALLFEKAITIVKYIDEYTDSTIPIIAVGGISTPEQAQKMLAIKSVKLIKIFTAFVFEGPLIIRKINKGILE